MVKLKGETVKDIKGYEGRYYVNNIGEVYSTPKDGKPNKMLKQEVLCRDHTNYRRVSLSKDGKVTRFSVHRLVAIAFIPNPEGKECINHIDNDGENNSTGNLEWCTHSENMVHSQKQGRLLKAQQAGGKAVGIIQHSKRLVNLDNMKGKTFGRRVFLYTVDSETKHPKAMYRCLDCNEEFQATTNTVTANVKKGKYLACRSCSLKHSHRTRKDKK